MGWFGARKTQSIADPELGEIRSDGRTCTVDVAGVTVAVVGRELTPSAREALLTFRTRFDELMRTTITDDLLELETNAGRTTARDAIFTVYTLTGVSLEVSNGIVLVEVGFEPGWSPDHLVTICLENWQSAGSSIDS